MLSCDYLTDELGPERAGAPPIPAGRDEVPRVATLGLCPMRAVPAPSQAVRQAGRRASPSNPATENLVTARRAPSAAERPTHGDPVHDPTQYPAGGAAAHVRVLAHHGLLAQHAKTACPAGRAWLCRGAYEIIWPVVFEGLTRVIERRRGHPTCGAAVEHLEPECLDRFHDDAEAVLDDLLRHAGIPIHNLEGWVRSRLIPASVDGHRRRRGERGALQRPRLPKWLLRLLGDDPWLPALALDILTWVGVPVAAGTSPWPYAAWAERRAAATGDSRSSEHDAARDVETVLAAMRHNGAWYERFVRSGPSVANTLRCWPPPEPGSWRTWRSLTRRDALDVEQLELAGTALDVMSARLARGDDHRSVITDVLGTMFGALLTDEAETRPAHRPGPRNPWYVHELTAAVTGLLNWHRRSRTRTRSPAR